MVRKQALRRAAMRQHVGMPIDALAQERFELALLLGQLGAGHDDQSAARGRLAGCRRRRSASRVGRAASRSPTCQSISSCSTARRSSIALQRRVRARARARGRGGHSGVASSSSSVEQTQLQRVVGVVRVVGDAVGRLDHLRFQQRARAPAVVADPPAPGLRAPRATGSSPGNS